MSFIRKAVSGFLVIAAVSLAVAAGAALAEDKTTAESSEQSRAASSRSPSAVEMQQMMGPMMGEMMSGMLRAMSKTMADPQIAQNFATFTRNYYKALIAQGFSEEEAMKIVMASGLPSMGAGK